MTSVIAVSDVHKRFGSGKSTARVLKGVALTVQRGEIVFLVGPSGSGKTTLLSILGCILTPDAGTVRVLDHEVGRMQNRELTRFRRDHLGFVFQNFHLFPTLSALDNVRLALTMKNFSLSNATTRARELLDRVGLSERVHSYPAQLSTGECQRVAIARALANDPKILFADEPTASLDAENGRATINLLCDCVQSQGMTLVVVTHDHRIFPFSDRILTLEDGNITDERSPMEMSNPNIYLEMAQQAATAET